jgi:hypothetical protein
VSRSRRELFFSSATANARESAFLELFWASSSKLFRFESFGRASASADGEGAAEAVPKGAKSQFILYTSSYQVMFFFS